MPEKNYSVHFVFDASPGEVFDAVTNVRGWWSENLQGSSRDLHDEFIYRYKDMHVSRQRLVEVVPGKRVVWLVTEATLTFVKDQHEWVNTRVVFDISREGDKTRLVFTHEGLTPSCECYDACFGGWNHYTASLEKLIRTKQGNPDRKPA